MEASIKYQTLDERFHHCSVLDDLSLEITVFFNMVCTILVYRLNAIRSIYRISADENCYQHITYLKSNHGCFEIDLLDPYLQ